MTAVPSHLTSIFVVCCQLLFVVVKNFCNQLQEMTTDPIVVDPAKLQWKDQHERKLKGPMAGHSWADKMVDPPVKIPSAYRLDDKEVSDAINKAKKNPLVPLGMIATTGALVMGLKAMYTGDRVLSQRMMRYRIGFQFATIFAIVGGLMVSTYAVVDESKKNRQK